MVLKNLHSVLLYHNLVKNIFLVMLLHIVFHVLFVLIFLKYLLILVIDFHNILDLFVLMIFVLLIFVPFILYKYKKNQQINNTKTKYKTAYYIQNSHYKNSAHLQNSEQYLDHKRAQQVYIQ